MALTCMWGAHGYFFSILSCMALIDRDFLLIQGKVLYQNASSLEYMGDLLSGKYDNYLNEGLLQVGGWEGVT